MHFLGGAFPTHCSTKPSAKTVPYRAYSRPNTLSVPKPSRVRSKMAPGALAASSSSGAGDASSGGSSKNDAAAAPSSAPRRDASSGNNSDKNGAAAAPSGSDATDAAASPAANADDAGASDYAAAEVDGTSSPDLEALLADFARQLELGQVDEEALKVLQELGVVRVRRAQPRGPSPLAPAPCTLEGVAEYIAAGKAQRIIVMCGAGVSTASGIPDFRTPGTGLYSQLEAYNLPTPEAIFELSYFRRNPKPFHLLAHELFPGGYPPTRAHHFMKLLHDKGLLLRVYTQNIDSLEREAGLPSSAVVAAHGNFDAASCIDCGAAHDTAHVKAAVMAGDVCKCTACNGLVKPDIVFFGENLPERFYDLAAADFPRCDLLIVMGTSLVVHPFASLIDCVGDAVPRLLVNREKAGERQRSYQLLPGLGGGSGFDFDARHRDVLYKGDTDAGADALADALGWREELDALVEAIAAARPDACSAGAGARLAAGIKASSVAGNGGGGAGGAVVLEELGTATTSPVAGLQPQQPPEEAELP